MANNCQEDQYKIVFLKDAGVQEVSQLAMGDLANLICYIVLMAGNFPFNVGDPKSQVKVSGMLFRISNFQSPTR